MDMECGQRVALTQQHAPPWITHEACLLPLPLDAQCSACALQLATTTDVSPQQLVADDHKGSARVREWRLRNALSEVAAATLDVAGLTLEELDCVSAPR